MLRGFNFSKPVLLPTPVVTYSNASNSHILQYQDLCSTVGVHRPPSQTDSDVTFPDLVIKEK